MAQKKGGEETSTPAPLSDLLLFAALCMVGLPVEVKVKDGSLYSGIFHTACFEKDRGIVLKKARKIHEGKCCSNLALGDCVDTLVVHSSDLVQVVVTEHLMPAEGIVGNVGSSAEVVSEIESGICDRNLEKRGKDTKCADISESREVIQCGPEGEKDDDPVEECMQVLEVHHLTPSSNANGAGRISVADIPIKLVSPESKDPSSANFALRDAKTSAHTACTTLASDITATSCSSVSASTDLSIPEKNAGSCTAQSSKLNPRAKIFTPSGTSLRPLPSVMPSTVTSSQMSNNLPLMPIGGAQLGTEVSYVDGHFSVPSKLVPHSNLIAARTGSTQPLLGYTSARQLPIGINGQYHHYQAGHLCPNAHSQMVMAGQLSQPAYVHPVSQGAIQQTYFMPQGQPHALLNHINAPKFQGMAVHNTRLPMTPLIAFGENQTHVPSSHVPFTQTFPTMQPVTLPGGDNNYFFH